MAVNYQPTYQINCYYYYYYESFQATKAIVVAYLGLITRMDDFYNYLRFFIYLFGYLFIYLFGYLFIYLYICFLQTAPSSSILSKNRSPKERHFSNSTILMFWIVSLLSAKPRKAFEKAG